MFWATVGRILWARRLIVAIVTLCALAGGSYVAITADRQYEATARVMINVYRPDPITGARLGRREINPYLASQLSFIRDIQVVLPAVEAVGWLDDPEIIGLYNARPPGDQRPLAIWLAQSVAAALQTSLVDDSNIVEIRYRGTSPELAALVAGAVRDAYIAGNIAERRRSAAEAATTLAEQSERTRRDLASLLERKFALERQTGIILPPVGDDLDTRRLWALVEPATAVRSTFIAPADSPQSGRLAQIESEIASASRTLGPNHPRLIELRSMRDSAAARVAAESAGGGEVASAVLAAERAKAAAFAAQRERVLNQRQDALRLRLLQDQINLKAKALETGLSRVAAQRLLTTSTESGLTSMGPVENEPGVAFPNVPLILGGSGGLGLLAGVLLALFVEVLRLRVRTISGLRVAAPIPVLGSMPAVTARAPTRRRRKMRARDQQPVAA